jgi:hypothetical protein
LRARSQVLNPLVGLADQRLRHAVHQRPPPADLFAAPSASPMIVAFLNGKQTPTTEFFGLDQTVEKLCVSWRVYHDFGAALCDYRAAVRSAGE